MSARRVLAGSALALLMPASLLMTTEISSARDEGTDVAPAVSVRKAARQKAKLVAMPQIVQQGGRTAAANGAKAALTATIRPVRAGRPVLLQVKAGSKWKKAGRTLQDRKGRAEFGARASRSGKALTYRVQALPFKGLKKVTSKPVSTERWLDATWTDEFSGSTLGSAWSHRGQSYEPSSLRNCSKGDPRAVSVGGGAVRVSVLKDSARGDQKCVARKDGKSTGTYAYRVNGHIGTQNAVSFKYGFAAARIKMHKSRGQHGGFWMQPQTSVPGATNPKETGAEIDVIEYFGDGSKTGGLTSFIYSKNSKGQDVKTGSWIKNPESFLKNRKDDWWKSYHVFSVEWTPKMYVFRIDGKETWRTKVGVSGQPQYPILSLLSSDYEIHYGGDKQLPQHMNVDWVRLWEA